MRYAGFELVEHADLATAEASEAPWYRPLSASWSMAGIQRTRVGRRLTRRVLRVLEAIRLAPEGCATVSGILNTAADSLVRGGEMGIFTPLYFFHARKPA